MRRAASRASYAGNRLADALARPLLACERHILHVNVVHEVLYAIDCLPSC